MKIAQIRSVNYQQNSSAKFRGGFVKNSALEHFKSTLTESELGIFERYNKVIEGVEDGKIFEYSIDEARKMAKMAQIKIVYKNRKYEQTPHFIGVKYSLKLFNEIFKKYGLESINRF